MARKLHTGLGIPAEILLAEPGLNNKKSVARVVEGISLSKEVSEPEEVVRNTVRSANKNADVQDRGNSD